MRICIDVGGTAVKYAVFNGDRSVLNGETPSQGINGAESLIDRVCSVVDGCGYTPEAIGLDVAGLCDCENGVIMLAENLGIDRPLEICSRINARYGVDCLLCNDVNAAALGEAYYGSAIGERDFLCLTYGTGIGGAIIMDGELFVGKGGMAGEMGHIVTHPGGRPCPCGQSGCYEQYASASALVRAVSAVEPDASDGRKIFSMMDRDYVRRAVSGWIDEVVLGLASLVHIFNPSSVVLGGGIMNEEYIIEQIKDRLPHRLISGYGDVKIKKAALGSRAGLYGMLHCLEQKERR